MFSETLQKYTYIYISIIFANIYNNYRFWGTYVLNILMYSIVSSATQNGASPLHAASEEGHTEVVHTLLKSGADPNLPTKVIFPSLMCVL